ncbi:MAG: tRNA epoxyqueuosine(34) reductase QueG [Rhodospirillales bacterium]|nr:tRNA epoxyqueuosine(34) reductase QueG [Rhodospirillales bacterium]
MNQAPAAAIRAHALALGFDAVGFAKPDPGEQARSDLDQYLAQGRQGDMEWMERRVGERGDPTVYFPPAKTAIMLALNYTPATMPKAKPGEGVISIYAQGRDYHDVMKPRLKTLCRWLDERYGAKARPFVDTAPVMEKPLAARAGLGWQGKHTNLVSRRFGSWLFLGGVLTDLELTPDPSESDRCGSCTRCLDACPTGALEPYRIEPRRCLSYLTIEHKGDWPADLSGPLGKRIYGCDACLAACPWNKFATPTQEAAFAPRFHPPLLTEFDSMTDEAFRSRFAGTPVKRTGLYRMRRNAHAARRDQGEVRHG